MAWPHRSLTWMLLVGFACGGGDAGGSGGSAASDDSAEDAEAVPIDLPDCYYGDGPEHRFLGLAIDQDGTALLAVISEETWCGPGSGYSCATRIQRVSPEGEPLSDVSVGFDLYSSDECVIGVAATAEHRAVVNGRFLRWLDHEGTELSSEVWFDLIGVPHEAIDVSEDGTIFALIKPPEGTAQVGHAPPEGPLEVIDVPVPELPVALAVVPDGLLVVGAGPFAMARYDDVGAMRWSVELPDGGQATAVAIGEAERSYVAVRDPEGSLAPRVVRLEPDGMLDPSFDLQWSGGPSSILAIAVNEPLDLVCLLAFVPPHPLETVVRCHDTTGALRWEHAETGEYQAVAGHITDTWLRIVPQGDVLAVLGGQWLPRLARFSPDGALQWIVEM